MNVIDPNIEYESFNGMSINDLKDNLNNLLSNGVTIYCNDGNDNIVLKTEDIVKRGNFKNIYLLNMVAIGDKVYDPSEYILKIRFSKNTPEYFENNKIDMPIMGTIPFNMAEGKRFDILDGEIKKHFATVLPCKTYILMKTDMFIVDFIIQERMLMSLDYMRENIKITDIQGIYMMNKLFEIANDFMNHG